MDLLNLPDGRLHIDLRRVQPRMPEHLLDKPEGRPKPPRFPSEDELERELDLPGGSGAVRLAQGALGDAERTRVSQRVPRCGRTWLRELNPVEDIEHLSAELQIPRRFATEVVILDQACIRIKIFGASEHVAADIAGAAEGLHGECGDRRTRLRRRRASGNGGIPNDVRPIAKARVFGIAASCRS